MAEQEWVELVAGIRPAWIEALGRDDPAAGQRLEQIELQYLADSLLTPQGRARLVDQTHLRGCDVLRWAFAAELLQLGISASDAVKLVNDGFTARDVLQDIKWGENGRWTNHTQDIDPATVETRLARLPIHFYDLLVVSDFHLAGGNHPSPEGIARFSPTEDFYFDDAFFRFLYYCEMERRHRKGYPYEIVFNGDMADFVQTVVKETAGFDLYDVALPNILSDQWWSCDDPQEKNREEGTSLIEQLDNILDDVYQDQWEDMKESRRETLSEGCYTSEEKSQPKKRRKVRAMLRRESLRQLKTVYAGHPRFFQGLAWFLAQGNRLVLMRGNHDPQWYWPEVQLAFSGWLKEAYDELCQVCKDHQAGYELPVSPASLTGQLPAMSMEDFQARVDFDHSWYYYRDRLAYFEHGGQQEAVDSQRYFLTPVYHTGEEEESPDPLAALNVSPQEKEIDPPVGSLGNVFFINNLEIEFPNFERPGYLDKVYRPWLLYHQPCLLFQTFPRALGKLLKAWREWAQHHPDPQVKACHQAKLAAYARLTGLPAKCVQELDTTRWVKTWRNRVFGYILFSLHVVLPIVPYLVVAIGIAVAIWGLPPQVDTFKSWLDIPVVKVLLPILSGGVTYWLTTLFSDWIGLGEDYLFKPAQRVAYILSKHGHDVPYYLFGHDHAHNAQVLETGKWYERNGCMVRLGKRHLHLQNIQVDLGDLRCPHCSAQDRRCVDVKALKAKVKQGAWQDHYHIRCPHCGKESRVNYDEDPSMEDLRGSCGCEFSADISADILELPRNSVSQAEYPQIWAYPHDFSGEELHCKHCGTPLPEEQLAQIKIIPPHVVFSRPKYGLEEYQWLDIWSLRCPVCQTELHKRNLRIRDGYAAIRCRKCGHESPGPSPVRRWYLNTGTWMHMFAKERKRLVRREHEYAFVRMIDTQRVVGSNPDTNNRPKVELLRWNDAAGRVEPCETFQGTDED